MPDEPKTGEVWRGHNGREYEIIFGAALGQLSRSRYVVYRSREGGCPLVMLMHDWLGYVPTEGDRGVRRFVNVTDAMPQVVIDRAMGLGV